MKMKFLTAVMAAIAFQFCFIRHSYGKSAGAWRLPIRYVVISENVNGCNSRLRANALSMIRDILEENFKGVKQVNNVDKEHFKDTLFIRVLLLCRSPVNVLRLSRYRIEYGEIADSNQMYDPIILLPSDQVTFQERHVDLLREYLVSAKPKSD